LITPVSNLKNEIKDLFNKRNLVITLILLAYLYNIFNPSSDNSSLFAVTESTYTSSIFSKLKAQTISNLSTFKLLPHLFIFCLFSLIQVFKGVGNIPKEIFLSFGILICGFLFSLIFYYHYDGTQFFVIPLTALLSVVFYFSLIQLLDQTILYGRFLGVISICLYLLSFVNSGHFIYTTPRALNMSSIDFNKEIAHFANEGNSINAIFLPSLNYKTNWIIAIPHFPFDVGYLNYFTDSKCIQPFSVSFFSQNEHYKKSALILISKGPFQEHCDELNLAPKSFYDKEFERAIISFIDKHSINTIIFNKSLEIPDWVNQLNIIKFIEPKEKYDKHKIFFINS
jgi:hypothetical protein